MQPQALKVNKLTHYKEQMMQVMRTNFPQLMEDTFKPGRIVYRLCDLSPEEMVSNGGFKTNSKLHISTTGSGDNTGSICFSLLPEIAAIFNNYFPQDKRRYIYACLLTGGFFAPGGKWRQVISPGAFPIPSLWIAREVIEIKENRELILGPMVGHAHKSQEVVWGDSFQAYSKPSLKLPKIIDYGSEDREIEFAIIDRLDSKKFQEKVSLYYEKTLRSELSATQFSL